jgi:hypothetical protein
MNIYESTDEFTGATNFFTDKLTLHKKSIRFGIPELTTILYFAQLKDGETLAMVVISRQGDDAQWYGVENVEIVCGDSRFSLDAEHVVEPVFDVEAGVLEKVIAEVDHAVLATLAAESSKIRVGHEVFELNGDFKEISQLMLGVLPS